MTLDNVNPNSLMKVLAYIVPAPGGSSTVATTTATTPVIDRFESATIGSIATNSSSYFAIGGPMRTTGSVIYSAFQNGTTSSATSGTTTGSSASVVLYKNASNAASVIATFNGSGTAVATLASALLVSSSVANASLGIGDVLIGEVRGGAANNGSQAGAFIVVDVQYLA